MYLEELIEVTIGLILVYIVMSLTVLQFQEWISGLLDKRAIFLEDILRKMLAEKSQTAKSADDSSEKPTPKHQGLSIVSRMYNHPLIRSLSRQGKRPSYIPADKFALALFDAVMTAGTDSSTIQRTLVELKSNLPDAVINEVKLGLDELIETSKEIKDNAAKLAELQNKIYEFARKFPQLKLGEMFDALLQTKLPTKDDEIIKQLKTGAGNLIVYNPELRQTIDSLILQAETYVKRGESILELARTNAENWFNDTMDRASGWYKRNAQKWAFGLGLGLALIFNVDTVQIATELWRQPLLRQSLVAAAEDFQLPETDLSSGEEVANAQDAIRQLRSTFTGLNIPIGWTFEPLGVDTYDPVYDRCTLFPRAESFQEDGKDVFGLAINGQCKVWSNAPQGWGLVTKLIGILVTGLATVQGAPFWFQILQKIINIRSTGTKPEEKALKK